MSSLSPVFIILAVLCGARVKTKCFFYCFPTVGDMGVFDHSFLGILFLQILFLMTLTPPAMIVFYD